MKKEYLEANFRQRLQDLMSTMDINQSQLAHKIEMSESAFSRFLKNPDAKLGDEYIIRLARHFNVSTDFLLGLTTMPDRKNYAIDELGLTPQAARNLYTKEVDPTVVSYLLENPTFAITTEQIAQYMNGSAIAGFVANNVIRQKLAITMISKGRRDLARVVQAGIVAPDQQDLNGIQNTFMQAVQEMKTDVELENAVEAMTQEQMDKMLKSLEKGLIATNPSITPQEFSSAIVDTIDWQGMLRPETMKQLQEALLAVAEDLQESDRRAKDGE